MAKRVNNSQFFKRVWDSVSLYLRIYRDPCITPKYQIVDNEWSLTFESVSFLPRTRKVETKSKPFDIQGLQLFREIRRRRSKTIRERKDLSMLIHNSKLHSNQLHLTVLSARRQHLTKSRNCKQDSLFIIKALHDKKHQHFLLLSSERVLRLCSWQRCFEPRNLRSSQRQPDPRPVPGNEFRVI